MISLSRTAGESYETKKFLILVCLLSVFTVVGLLCVEGLLRFRQYINYGSASVSLYRVIQDPVSGLRIPAPGQNNRSIWINSKGFRSPELVTPKPPGTVRLAFVGASTTFSAEVSSNEATWPHLVWKAMQQTWPKIKFDYLNAGVPGYGTITSLRNLEYRVKPQDPDVIVIYEGFNDVTKDTRELAEQQGLFTGEMGEPSFMARWSLTWKLLENNLKLRMRSQKTSTERRLVFDRERLASRGFENRLRQLVDEARHTAPVVALATLPIKARRDQPEGERLRAAQWFLFYMPFMTPDGILTAFDEYNRMIRTVARESSVILVEGEDTIPGDDQHFKDEVHYTDQGSVLMAKRVVRALLQSDAFKDLIDSLHASKQRVLNHKHQTSL